MIRQITSRRVRMDETLGMKEPYAPPLRVDGIRTVFPGDDHVRRRKRVAILLELFASVGDPQIELERVDIIASHLLEYMRFVQALSFDLKGFQLFPPIERIGIVGQSWTVCDAPQL